MSKKILIFTFICIMYGCATQATHTSYRELFRENDLAAERFSSQFYQKAKLHCPEMIRDYEEMHIKLNVAEASGHENISKKLRKDIKWLKGWIDSVDCDHAQASSQDKNEDEAAVQESEPAETGSGQPSHGNDRPAVQPSLSFDECFSKCKELTSRTNEVCFDACIKR